MEQEGTVSKISGFLKFCWISRFTYLSIYLSIYISQVSLVIVRPNTSVTKIRGQAGSLLQGWEHNFRGHNGNTNWDGEMEEDTYWGQITVDIEQEDCERGALEAWTPVNAVQLHSPLDPFATLKTRSIK